MKLRLRDSQLVNRERPEGAGTGAASFTLLVKGAGFRPERRGLKTAEKKTRTLENHKDAAPRSSRITNYELRITTSPLHSVLGKRITAFLRAGDRVTAVTYKHTAVSLAWVWG